MQEKTKNPPRYLSFHCPSGQLRSVKIQNIHVKPLHILFLLDSDGTDEENELTVA